LTLWRKPVSFAPWTILDRGKESAMRVAPIAVFLFIASTAHAQSGALTTSNDLFGRGAPKQIQFVPVDTSRAIAPQASLGQAVRPTSSKMTNPFNLSSIFPKISMPSWPPKSAQVSVLPQAQNIYQPTPPKGAVSLFGSANKRVN
jgi:hypothetical protein